MEAKKLQAGLGGNKLAVPGSKGKSRSTSLPRSNPCWRSKHGRAGSAVQNRVSGARPCRMAAWALRGRRGWDK